MEGGVFLLACQCSMVTLFLSSRSTVILPADCIDAQGAIFTLRSRSA